MVISSLIFLTVLSSCSKKDTNIAVNSNEYFCNKSITTVYNNKKETRTEYVYRQDGQILKTTVLNADSSVSKALYEYDSNNRLVKVSASKQDKEESTVELNYVEQNGNQIGRGIMYENGKYDGYIEYTYNNNRLIKKSIFNELDELINYYIFDSIGHTAEYFARLGSSKTKYQYVYDQKGNLIKLTVFIDNVMNYYQEYEYTDKKLIKTTSYNENNEKTDCTVQTSSEKNTVKLTKFDMNDVIIGYRTDEYDDFGNLIKITSYTADNQASQIDERFWSKIE